MFACFCGGRPQTAEEPALAKAKAAAASKEGWQSGEPHEPLIGTALTPEEGPAAEASQPAIDEPDSPGSGQEGQAAAEGAAASGDGGAADGGVATDVAAQPSKVEEIEGQGSAGADEAADDEAAAAGEVPDRSAAAEEAAAEGAPPVAAEGSAGAAAPPAAEGSESSQAALLSPHEEDASVLSLKAPRLSRLSALFSCSSSGAVLDGGELRSQQQVGREVALIRWLGLHSAVVGLHEIASSLSVSLQPLPSRLSLQSMQGGGGSARVTHASTPTPIDLQFEAAAAELALLPRSKLLALAQPEQALADAAGMLGRCAGGMG